MANPTTNYGFVMPTSTDLVTDLPADFDVFGQAVDTQMLTNANAAIAKAIVDAKGDIIVATAADTVSLLAVGADDTVLTADSSEATGLKWAAAAGGGKILQVISAELATQAISSTSTYADTGLTATITPTNATSTILVISNCAIGKDTGNTGVSLRLLRGATTIKEFARSSAADGGSGENFVGTFSHSYIDSPATTSATTYKVQFASYNNTARVYVSGDFGGVKEKSTILLMEIGA